MSTALRDLNQILGRIPCATNEDDAAAFMSAAQLLAGTDEEPDWLVNGLLLTGGSSLLVAPPKVGKSVFAQNLAVAVSQGRPFLDLPTRPGTVLYLALEEKQAEYRRHLRALGLTASDPLHSFIGSAPDEGLEWLSRHVAEHEAALIVIDTMKRFTRLSDLNDYGQVSNALEPIMQLARDSGAHLLLTHHSRKGGGEHGDGVLGSQALFASVDTLMQMKRSERYRTVQSIQRYGTDLDETVLEMDPGTFRLTCSGSRHDVDARSIADQIEAYLSTLGPGEEAERDQIETNVEARTGLLRETLKGLVEAGRLTRSGQGKRGDPYRYSLSCSRASPPTRNNGNKKQETVDFPRGDATFSCSQPLTDSAARANIREQETDGHCPRCGTRRTVLGTGLLRCHRCGTTDAA